MSVSCPEVCPLCLEELPYVEAWEDAPPHTCPPKAFTSTVIARDSNGPMNLSKYNGYTGFKGFHRN